MKKSEPRRAEPTEGWLEPFVLRISSVARHWGPIEIFKSILSRIRNGLGHDNRTVDSLVVLALASTIALCAIASLVFAGPWLLRTSVFAFCVWRILEVQVYTFDVLFAAPLRLKVAPAQDTRLTGPVRHLVMRFLNYLDMILLFAILNYSVRQQLSQPDVDIIGCILYSATVMLTLGYGAIVPTGTGAQLMAISAELLGGFFLLTALAYTVSVVSSLHELGSSRFLPAGKPTNRSQGKEL